MKIANGENLWGFGEIGTDLGPDLRPAVEGGAEECEKLLLHAEVFEAEIFLVEMSALGQPGFELAGCFNHVHAGNDSGGANGKSNELVASTSFNYFRLLKTFNTGDTEAQRGRSFVCCW